MTVSTLKGTRARMEQCNQDQACLQTAPLSACGWAAMAYQSQGEEQGHAEDDHKPATAASLRPPLLLCLCRSLSRGRARGFARVQEAGILC